MNQKDLIPDSKSEQTQVALAVDRISKALAATPMNIALAALAVVVGQAQYGLQKDRQKRERNLDTYMGSVRTAIMMSEHAEINAEASKSKLQMEDPIKKIH